MYSPNFYRRCQCEGPLIDKKGNPVLNDDGTPKIGSIGLTCKKLGRKGHGSWAFTLELERGKNGKRQRVRLSGFPTREKAEEKAKEVYKQAELGTDVVSDETVGEFLGRWIKAKKSLARTTRHGYEEHIALYLGPHLGHIKRRDLRVRHLDRMYDAIQKENAERVLHRLRVDELAQVRDAAHTAWVRAAGKKEERRRTRKAYLAANKALREGRKGLRKVTSAATTHRINDTLSSALSWGIKTEEAFAKNWAQLVELPAVARPKPLVWTPERIAHWKKTGEKPGPVMVWTPEQTGQFLDFLKDDRLYSLWYTFIFSGPRRGEMCALPWSEVSLDALWLRISAQIVEVAYRQYGEAPKAESVRTNWLSLEHGEVLSRWRERQARDREEWAGVNAWVESDRVWTHENGEALHPDWVSRRFKRLVELSGLPPVRLLDLRHISATLSLLAKNDIKVVQERLGHSSRQITSDTYTSVLPEMMRTEAESTLSVVPREVAYDVQQELEIPKEAFQGDVAVIFAHGARDTGNTWVVATQTGPQRPLLGGIRTVGRGQEHAADAALKWVRDHCADRELEILRIQNLNDQYPEDQRPHFALLRFFIARPDGPDVSQWGPPAGPNTRPGSSRGHADRRSSRRSRKAA
ncbi:tyrosine-type recombinase/integrase [Streptomyces sp. NPDC021218]|uniref:tyrosine-type recombinase/integrase n=1 Tax=Streptomyces sp. NPDC021218 TaxID=3365119 RepID=UPI0037A30F6F